LTAATAGFTKSLDSTLRNKHVHSSKWLLGTKGGPSSPARNAVRFTSATTTTFHLANEAPICARTAGLWFTHGTVRATMMIGS
jgi:hypothetical protein